MTSFYDKIIQIMPVLTQHKQTYTLYGALIKHRIFNV